MDASYRPSPQKSSATEQHTFIFAGEIEAALVSTVWHQPDWLATVYRELDPAVHLTQPHLRWLLEAIDLAYRDLGCVNFEVVIQVLRETGHLEDCGALDGVNQIYGLEEYGREDPVRNEKIFRHYLEMLKTYAVHRKMELPPPVYHFLSAKSTLQLNKIRRSDADPDYVGQVRLRGRSYVVKVWKSLDGEFLNVSFKPL